MRNISFTNTTNTIPQSVSTRDNIMWYIHEQHGFCASPVWRLCRLSHSLDAIPVKPSFYSDGSETRSIVIMEYEWHLNITKHLSQRPATYSNIRCRYTAIGSCFRQPEPIHHSPWVLTQPHTSINVMLWLVKLNVDGLNVSSTPL